MPSIVQFVIFILARARVSLRAYTADYFHLFAFDKLSLTCNAASTCFRGFIRVPKSRKISNGSSTRKSAFRFFACTHLVDLKQIRKFKTLDDR